MFVSGIKNGRLFRLRRRTLASVLLAHMLLLSWISAQTAGSGGHTDTSTHAEPQAQGQVPSEFQSHGIEYEALTHNGITVMFAALPPHIKEYNVVQLTITNGSLVSWTAKPSDFTFIRQNGIMLSSVSADEVVSSLMEHASTNDVVKLQLLYEDTIYGLANFRSTNGYEQRRQAGMAQFVNKGFRAAAAASAITMVPTKLKPGDSTDGAVFFENKTKEKALGPGHLVGRTCGETFSFEVYPELKVH